MFGSPIQNLALLTGGGGDPVTVYLSPDTITTDANVSDLVGDLLVRLGARRATSLTLPAITTDANVGDLVGVLP